MSEHARETERRVPRPASSDENNGPDVERRERASEALSGGSVVSDSPVPAPSASPALIEALRWAVRRSEEYADGYKRRAQRLSDDGLGGGITYRAYTERRNLHERAARLLREHAAALERGERWLGSVREFFFRYSNGLDVAGHPAAGRFEDWYQETPNAEAATRNLCACIEWLARTGNDEIIAKATNLLAECCGAPQPQEGEPE